MANGSNEVDRLAPQAKLVSAIAKNAVMMIAEPIESEVSIMSRLFGQPS